MRPTATLVGSQKRTFEKSPSIPSDQLPGRCVRTEEGTAAHQQEHQLNNPEPEGDAKLVGALEKEQSAGVEGGITGVMRQLHDTVVADGNCEMDQKQQMTPNSSTLRSFEKLSFFTPMFEDKAAHGGLADEPETERSHSRGRRSISVQQRTGTRRERYSGEVQDVATHSEIGGSHKGGAHEGDVTRPNLVKDDKKGKKERTKRELSLPPFTGFLEAEIREVEEILRKKTKDGLVRIRKGRVDWGKWKQSVTDEIGLWKGVARKLDNTRLETGINAELPLRDVLANSEKAMKKLVHGTALQ